MRRQREAVTALRSLSLLHDAWCCACANLCTALCSTRTASRVVFGSVIFSAHGECGVSVQILFQPWALGGLSNHATVGSSDEKWRYRKQNTSCRQYCHFRAVCSLRMPCVTWYCGVLNFEVICNMHAWNLFHCIIFKRMCAFYNACCSMHFSALPACLLRSNLKDFCNTEVMHAQVGSSGTEPARLSAHSLYTSLKEEKRKKKIINTTGIQFAVYVINFIRKIRYIMSTWMGLMYSCLYLLYNTLFRAEFEFRCCWLTPKL